MPIQKHNRLLRQYYADLSSVKAADFLNLVEECQSHPLMNPIVQSQVTLQFTETQITGDVAEARKLLSELGDGDRPHTFSANINANTNPRRTLSLSINFAQSLVTFNLQNSKPDEGRPLLDAFVKIFSEEAGPPKRENSRETPESTRDALPSPALPTEYLPGVFRPVPMPQLSEKDVFVIMSFDRQHRDAFNLAIARTLQQLGFNPVRVDQIQHNNTVTPEIMRQIERSVFVVADLTGERPNVYYEVGYAHRADKEVVLLARNNTSVHFDVAAINRIDYDDYTELTEALEKRVRAIADRLGIPLSPNSSKT